jgi:hypothetical protein
MRRANRLLAGYVLAVGAVTATLLAGHLGAAHAVAFVPFALLLLAVTTGPRPRGWIVAAAALACTSLTVMSFASLAGDQLGQAGLPAGTILLLLALFRGGARAGMRRHRVVTAIVGTILGFSAFWGVLGLVLYLPPALRPVPRGCVDTCWGVGLAALLSAVWLVGVLLATIVAIAFGLGWCAGLGVLAVVVAENVMFYFEPPSAGLIYGVALPAWYLGLLAFAWPWIGRSSVGKLRADPAAGPDWPGAARASGAGGIIDADTQAERGGQGILQVADP